MASIRELVQVLRQRDGVDAVIVVGRDGLVIDGASETTYDADALAVLVSPMTTAAMDLGHQARAGALGILVAEYDHGATITMALSVDAFLFLLVRHGADLGGLLYELRRHRSHLSALA